MEEGVQLGAMFPRCEGVVEDEPGSDKGELA